jgi:tellurite resistance-related uncharacterized protein
MKKTNLLITMLLLLCPLLVFGQSETETIKKSFKVSTDSKEMWLCICNIQGDVEVEAYDGNTIELVLEKEVSGSRQSDVTEGMQELQIDVNEGDDFVKVQMKAPYITHRGEPDRLNCNSQWSNDNDRDYRFRYDYKIKVPRHISIKISTVNNGDLFVKGVEGEVYANNVNGDVALEGIKENTKAHTVNGTIDVRFTALPSEFGKFQTVNGDIEIYAPANSGAIYNFETSWGEVFSDFEFSKKIAPEVVTNKKRGSTKYMISNSNSYQVGDGGPKMDFETLNGDILIRKANN